MCLPWIDDYDFFGSLDFGNLKFQPSLRSLFPRAHDRLMCVLLDRTANIHFDSPASKISILNFSSLTLPGVHSPRAHDQLTHVLLWNDGPRLLHLFIVSLIKH
jgi:hypothetical protein